MHVNSVFTNACIPATENAIVNDFSHRTIYCIGNAVAQSTFVNEHGSPKKVESQPAHKTQF